MQTTSHVPAAGPSHHITPRTYIIIFGWLTVLTALEVLVAAIGLDESLRVPLLVIVAIAKALLVVLFYMHLRYDNRWYWFTLLAPVGFVILLSTYLFQH
jgi:cytochrome c oxidase subunit IV